MKTILNFIWAGLAVATPAQASERRFTYTYGSDVLQKGAFEMEPWSTVEVGRDSFYLGFDHRVELEAGLSDRVQAALYLRLAASTQAVGDALVSETHWNGLSFEVKWKLADPVANPVGFALYLEPELGLGEAGLEGKVIVDKRIGGLYLAFNPVVEQEWEFAAPGELAPELKTELDLGAAWFVSHAVSAGVEIRQSTVFPAGEGVEFAALFVGPTVSYASKGDWWSTLTVMPQLPALVRYDPVQPLELHDDSRVAVRLLLGVDL